MSDTVIKLLSRDPSSGFLASIPSGAIVDIAGTTSQYFTVAGKGVMLADGSSSDPNQYNGISFQNVYDNSVDTVYGTTNAVITLALNKDFVVYDPTGKNVIFSISSNTGAVTVTTDLIVTGQQTVINTTINDVDHFLISPAGNNVVALQIEPDPNVYPLTDVVNVKVENGGDTVFSIDSQGGTNLANLYVSGNITIDGMVDGVDVSSLNTAFLDHTRVSANKHQAKEINIWPSSLQYTPSNLTTVQAVLGFFDNSINNNRNDISTLQSQMDQVQATMQTLEPIVNTPQGMTFLTGTATTVWTIQHNKNTYNFVYVLFDENGIQFLPDEAKIVDENNFQLTFSQEQSGRLNMIFYA